MSERYNDSSDMKDLLKQFVEKNKLEKGLDKVNAEQAWNELMGNGVANYTTAVNLRGEVLTIQLSSSVLREELSYGKQKIIDMMNESLGKKLISKIVFR